MIVKLKRALEVVERFSSSTFCLSVPSLHFGLLLILSLLIGGNRVDDFIYMTMTHDDDDENCWRLLHKKEHIVFLLLPSFFPS